MPVKVGLESTLRARRSARTVGFAAAITATLPLVLTACAPVADAEVYAAQLHASADADILTIPTARVYQVTETNVMTPISGALGRALDHPVKSTGSLVLKDGVITEAHIGLHLGSYPEAVFELTEPAVLRREGSSKSTVRAIGTVSVDGLLRHDISVELTPTVLTQESVEFDVQFAVPDNPFLVGRSIPLDQLSAHLVLDAQE
ncbi:hypothetical protein [Leucobacter chromiireducens]|uniref:YceI family protein n=1 Tax=Leucobacter chromiireducens subsp. solipictus TaxID=398235 RepID=A0ABS1SCQ8_9MICO|nr:hypothetical protein [Leucobacter chromiireducens]MBL3678319.1 hypothetical protein [Leucobacter chromiireducens subsp. solipictus]